MIDRPFSEVVEIRGHIIDSMILPSIMDEIMDRGGDFDVQVFEIGRRKDEPSYARLEIRAGSREELDALVDRVGRLGASAVQASQVRTEPAPRMASFPTSSIRRPTCRRTSSWTKRGCRSPSPRWTAAS